MTRMARVSMVLCVLVSVIVIAGGAFTANAANLRRIVTFNNLSDRLLYKVTWSLGDGITTIKLVHDLSLINALAIQLPTLGTDQALAFLLNLVVQGVVEGVYDDTVGTVDGGSHPVCIVPALPPSPEGYPWGQQHIDVDMVHPQWQGSGVTVAVLDTGIDSHLELMITEGYNARAGEDPSDWQDGNGHGTHMAGIIAADRKTPFPGTIGIVGAAPQVTLKAVKVLDQDGAGYLSDVINGLQWVHNNGSPLVQVVNISIGFSSNSQNNFESGNHPLKKAIQALDNSHVIMVASAGNHCGKTPGEDEGGDAECLGGSTLPCDPSQTGVRYPAAYPQVLAVVASDITDHITAYSLSGPAVDVAGPGGSKATGIRILSTDQGGGYGEGSGTSQAAAHVTGAVALALQKKPQLQQSFNEVRSLLQTTGVSLPGGIRLINVYNMLLALP
jgi:subtilisin family serine protease